MNIKRQLFCLGVLILLVFGVTSIAYADSSISWEIENVASYDTSKPGTILEYLNPLSQGGMNLTDTSYTSEDEADIVFSSDGQDIAGRGVIDLGEVDFETVFEVPDSGYNKSVDCIPGHVYIVSTHDGGFAKIYIDKNLGSSVTFKYALGVEDNTAVVNGTDVTYDMFVPGTILLIDNPINQGGLNFLTGQMTTNPDETDIAISGSDIGSRAIVDLGPIDFESVTSEPNSGYSKMVDLTVGNVYITQTNDGKYIKFLVKSILSSTVELVYKEINHLIDSIEIKGDISNTTKPVSFYVEGTCIDGKIFTLESSEIIWESSDPSIATIDEDGVARFSGKAGIVTFTADYQGIVNTRSVKITVLSSIKINQIIKYSSKPIQLSITGTYSDGRKVSASTGITWTSSNKSVATVDSKGILRFTGRMGKVTITAKVGTKISSVTYTVGNVLVYLKPSTTKISYSTKPIKLGVYARYANGKTYKITKGVTWKSSNTYVAKVNSSGTVTFTGKNGSVTITGYYKDQKVTFTTNVFIRANELKYYTGKTWRIYMDYVQLDVGTLKLQSNGIYVWKKPTGVIVTGKWVFNSKNTITLYKFGYNQNLTYEMGRYGSNQVGIFYNNGESGSDYYIGK